MEGDAIKINLVIRVRKQKAFLEKLEAFCKKEALLMPGDEELGLPYYEDFSFIIED